MTINEIYIEAFGKLSNERITPSVGLSSFVAENGYGKTTLTYFIKAMLYGLDDARRSVSENERKRYLPWDGKNASGYIVISEGKRQLRIERSFGKKASDDTLAVFDLSLGKQTDEFGESPGERLFGIDRDGFERTVFISEKMLSGKINNDTVTSKLSDLVGVEYDIGEFENAKALLEDEKRILSKRGGLGLITDYKNRIATLEAEERALLLKKSEYESSKKRLGELKLALASAKSRHDSLAVLRRAADEQKQMAGISLQYKKSKDFLSSLEEDEKKLMELFGGTPPTMEEIIVMRGKRAEQKRLEAELTSMGEERENPFKSAPTEEKIEMLRGRLSGTTRASGSGPLRHLFPLGLAAMALFAVLGFTVNPILFLGVILGALATAVGISSFGRAKEIKLYRAIEDEIIRYAKEVYITLPDTCSAEELLDKLTSDFGTMLIYNKETEKHSSLLCAYNDCKKEADEFFGRFDIPEAELVNKLYDYETLRKSISQKRDELKEFEKCYGPMEKTSPWHKEEAEARDYDAEIKEAFNNIISIGNEITKLSNESERLLSEIDKADTLSEELAEANERLNALNNRLKVITLTLELLTKAKDNMTARYLDGTKTAFLAYLEAFSVSGVFTMDTDFEISKNDIGGSKERDAFSKGTRELYSLALRLALVDTLYGDAAPPIIIDDAFASFDDKRINSARVLLAELSKTRQIIYLTCSQSRDMLLKN